MLPLAIVVTVALHGGGNDVDDDEDHHDHHHDHESDNEYGCYVITTTTPLSSGSCR